MQFPDEVVNEITVPNNVPFAPGYDVIGIGTQLPPAVIAAGYPAAILFYSSDYNPLSNQPQIKYQFIADKDGTIFFGYGLVMDATVSQNETIVTYEGHGFAGTAAQSHFNYVDADSLTADQASIDTLASNTSFLYKGTELQDLLDALQAQITGQQPLGLVAFGSIQEPSGGWVATGAVRVAMFYIGANLTVGRTYRVNLSGIELNPSTANGSISLDITYTTNGTVPGTTTGGATSLFEVFENAVPQFNNSALISRPFTPLVSAQWNFLVVLNNTRASHPTNAAARILYGLTADMTVEDIGPALPNTITSVFTPPPPAPTTYNVSQLCTASRAFNGNNTLNNNNAEMYMGQSPFAPNGIQYSDYFFQGSGPNTLAYIHSQGATPAQVSACAIRLCIRHWYYSSGGIIRVGWTDSGGYHTLADYNCPPAPVILTLNLKGTGAAPLLAAICAGTVTSFNLAGNNAGFRPPAGNFNYYGYCDGKAQSSPPLFTATFAV